MLDIDIINKAIGLMRAYHIHRLDLSSEDDDFTSKLLAMRDNYLNAIIELGFIDLSDMMDQITATYPPHCFCCGTCCQNANCGHLIQMENGTYYCQVYNTRETDCPLGSQAIDYFCPKARIINYPGEGI